MCVRACGCVVVGGDVGGGCSVKIGWCNMPSDAPSPYRFLESCMFFLFSFFLHSVLMETPPAEVTPLLLLWLPLNICQPHLCSSFTFLVAEMQVPQWLCISTPHQHFSIQSPRCCAASLSPEDGPPLSFSEGVCTLKKKASSHWILFHDLFWPFDLKQIKISGIFVVNSRSLHN